MSELVWFNGRVAPMSQTHVSVEDRGYQFADGVYEVIRFYRGKLFLLREHLQRLGRSAEGIRIPMPLTIQELTQHILDFVPRTGISDGYLYLQLSRGVAERNHRFPAGATPVLLFYARHLPVLPPASDAPGITLLGLPDDRWKRCWIKSIALLANVLAKNEAISAGYDEPAFVDDGVITEGATSNVFALIEGKLITHPIGPKVLPGITRAVIMDLAREMGVEVQERAIREQEIPAVQELFITSTTREIGWVMRWNDITIGKGTVGPVTAKLHQAYRRRIERDIAE